jgi:hypothetical protein
VIRHSVVSRIQNFKLTADNQVESILIRTGHAVIPHELKALRGDVEITPPLTIYEHYTRV